MRFIRGLLIFTYICLFFHIDTGFSIAQCDNPNGIETVRIYFANGMNNEPKDRFDGRRALQNLVGSNSTRTFGNSINTKEGFIRQILEVGVQKQAESKQIWHWFADISLSPQWFKNAFNDYMSLVSGVSYALDGELRVTVNEYLQDLNSGKMVVIVSHSQGNFYANSAYQYIYNNFQSYRNSIGIVAVGTPASRVQDRGPHTNNSEDLILNLVRTRYYVLPATGTYDEPGSVMNHNFINTYLAAFGSKINNDIIQTINSLNPPEKTFECKDPSEVPVIVNSTFASNISTTTAQLNGYVASGKQIGGICIRGVSPSVDPATCSDRYYSIPESGPFDTGDSLSCTATGLTPGAIYRYRVCGREGSRFSDGGIKSFTTDPEIIQCDSSYNASGSSEGLNVDYNMGTKGAFANMEFTTFTIPDKLEIWHGGVLIYTTGNYSSTGSTPMTKRICHEPSRGSTWNVKVYGNPDTGTAWTLSVACPQNTSVFDMCPTQ